MIVFSSFIGVFLFVFNKWLFSQELPDAFEGLPELALLKYIKDFFTKYGHIPLWCPLRNSGMPLHFFLLPGWWAWNFPLIIFTIISNEVVATKLMFVLFMVLSGITSYHYFMRLTHHRMGSVIGALIYSTNGLLITYGVTHFHVNVPMFFGTLPLVFLTIDKVINKVISNNKIFPAIIYASLITWFSFSSQPLFFLISVAPFIPIRVVYLLRHHRINLFGSRVFISSSIFFLALLALNLWWIIPQFSYINLYELPKWEFTAIGTRVSPISTPTVLQLLTMQTFAGGGTEALKDPAITGWRFFGFILPFLLSLTSPLVCRGERDVRFYFACFSVPLIVFLLTISLGYPISDKYVIQPFFAACLSAFSIKGICNLLNGKGSLKRRKFVIRYILVIVLVAILVLIASSNLPEMYKLVGVYTPNKSMEELYAHIPNNLSKKDFSVLNIPFFTPIDKPIISRLKPQNFVGYYYVYLTDYLTIKHGLKNVYGPLNEFEVNRYTFKFFHLLDQLLREKRVAEFCKLIKLIPDLKYIVVYKDLVSDDITSFLKSWKEFKLVYENDVGLLLQVRCEGEYNKVWLVSEPPTLIATDVWKDLVTLVNLAYDVSPSYQPFFFLLGEGSCELKGFQVLVPSEEKTFWAYEAEDVFNGTNIFVSEPFKLTSFAPSNGKTLAIKNGGVAEFDFYIPESGQFYLSFRIFHSRIDDPIILRRGILSFEVDSVMLGNYVALSDYPAWKWLNFTVWLKSGHHKLVITNKANYTSIDDVDVLVISRHEKFDDIIQSSKSIAISYVTHDNDIIIEPAIVHNSSNYMVMVISDAYFPSLKLLAENFSREPMIINNFLTAFTISTTSVRYQVTVSPSLLEQVAFSISLATIVFFIVLVASAHITHKWRLADEARLRHSLHEK
jgi:hypothetical protein